MGINIDVSQVAALGSRLAGAGGRVGAKASAAFRKTILDIEADAKMLIEAYDAVDTGDMMNSVSSTITGDGRTGTMTGEVGPTVDYGLYVHEGTSVMPGRPFLGDAWDRRVPPYTQALAKIAESETL
ncbi:MAG TPA: hypothetical protein VGE38_07150 [Nocardioides sp.]|uniref:hypothetical protein n=1 Tax=Nocardioides sp. TaxID=35761 RepID=UPI002ED848D0